MKNILLIFSGFIILISCNNTTNISLEPSIEEIEMIKPMGDQISKDLLVSLQSELKNAIESGGFEKAMDVCNLKAIPLTEIVERSTDRQVKIKRTTYKNRNKLNEPDTFEKLALDYFIAKTEKGENIPDFYIQKTIENKETFYYYYKPLKVNAVCLNCHGTPENMQVETLAKIKEYYPDDKATGYEDGDFRGLVSIKIPEKNN
jgi:hypothetical protein